MEMELTQSDEPGEQFSALEQTQTCGQLPWSNDPADCSPREECLTPHHPCGAADMPHDLQQLQNSLLQGAVGQMLAQQWASLCGDLLCSYPLQSSVPQSHNSGCFSQVLVWWQSIAPLLLTLKPLQVHYRKSPSSSQRREAAEGRGNSSLAETSPNQFSFLVHLFLHLCLAMHESAALFLLARTRSHTQTHLWAQDAAGDTGGALQSVFQSHELNFKQCPPRAGN